MIVLRKKPYYIVSSNPDLEKHILHPAVPNNFLTRGGYIDSKLPRVPIFKTIGDAISATFLGQKLRPGMKLCVYEVQGIFKESLLGPLSIDKIPYFRFVKEWWYLKPINVKYITEIRVGDLIKTDIYYYGPRQTKAYIYHYDWSEIIPKYKEKFGPKLQKTYSDSDPLDSLNERQLERLANKVVSHRKKERMLKNKLKEAKTNTIATNETKPNLTLTAQDEATQRAAKMMKYKKALKSEEGVIKRELINTIKNDNTKTT